jgi:CRP-like cAMP-binding protein
LQFESRVSDSTNRVLTALPVATRRAVWPLLSRRRFEQRDVLYEMGERVSYLYFVESGLVAFAKPMRDGRTAEIGLTGREGIVTPTAAFGADVTVMDSIAATPCTTLRMRYDDYRERLARDPDFAAAIQSYVALAMSQLTQTAACNTLHTIEERCCRWFLIAHDNAPSGRFSLTHEFIATMLGVRRASVQAAAATLQGAGLVRYSRGNVSVTDRAGLEGAACECYRTIRRQIDEHFPS